ncbi:hypothetical protein DQ04_02551040 [Trypanosoma grayi]|uniref:hypothetical protein n=1 Tax=Trypanosoma grayi TaxID=71804 RepID=UPI0004F3FEF5|nr:hypothetical protein DQ04_02551040 [Trypanosoma grayi]KEG11507.1 hypothetical protein DQ04_02551040 [Trypanosoma grayi]
MESAGANTIPFALASAGCLQHALVRVELTNGVVMTGRIVQLDAETMNMKLDAVSDTAVRHRRCSGSDEKHATVTWEADPAALRCTNSVVIRGCHVRYIDFVDEEVGGGRGLHELMAAACVVRPSLA